VNGKLEGHHLEQLILLFKHFEGINGLRDALLSDLAQTLFEQLTPEKIDALANRHNLAPTHAEPWKKIFIGGSDDHGGQFAASASRKRLLRFRRQISRICAQWRLQRARPRRHPLNPVARLFITPFACFIQDRFHEKLGRARLCGENVFALHGGPAPLSSLSREKRNLSCRAFCQGKIFEFVKPANVSLWKELSGYFARPGGEGKACSTIGQGQ
jgi:hypothetical protein